jgi:uncharacterized ion transporter superfamily protein YfcC
MKKYIILLISVVITAVITYIITSNSVEEKSKDVFVEYIKATDELLWEIEEMCNYHNIDWGDTVCEGDNWDNFCEIRSLVGLEPLVHWSEKGE